MKLLFIGALQSLIYILTESKVLLVPDTRKKIIVYLIKKTKLLFYRDPGMLRIQV